MDTTVYPIEVQRVLQSLGKCALGSKNACADLAALLDEHLFTAVLLAVDTKKVPKTVGDCLIAVYESLSVGHSRQAVRIAFDSVVNSEMAVSVPVESIAYRFLQIRERGCITCLDVSSLLELPWDAAVRVADSTNKVLLIDLRESVIAFEHECSEGFVTVDNEEFILRSAEQFLSEEFKGASLMSPEGETNER